MILVGGSERHRGRTGCAIGHGGLRLDHPARFGRRPFTFAEAAIGIERPTAERSLDGIPADALCALRFGEAAHRKGVVAKQEIAVLAPAVADGRASLGAFVNPIPHQPRERQQHLLRRGERIIGKFAVGGYRPVIPNLIAHGDVAELGSGSAILSRDAPHSFLDREAVTERPHIGHLKLHDGLGKLREKCLEEAGDLRLAHIGIAIFVDQLAPFHEVPRQALGISAVEGLDGGLHLLGNLGDQFRGGSRCLYFHDGNNLGGLCSISRLGRRTPTSAHPSQQRQAEHRHNLVCAAPSSADRIHRVESVHYVQQLHAYPLMCAFHARMTAPAQRADHHPSDGRAVASTIANHFLPRTASNGLVFSWRRGFRAWKKRAVCLHPSLSTS